MRAQKPVSPVSRDKIHRLAPSLFTAGAFNRRHLVSSRLVMVAGVLMTIAFTIANASAARIAAWDFFGTAGSQATQAAAVFDANLDSSNLLTRGAGAAGSAGTNSFRTLGFKNDGISTANTDYFEFTLSAASGYTLSLSSIDARVAGTSSYFPATIQFAYSTDGSTFTLIGSSQSVATSGSSIATIDLTGISALQTVIDTTTVTFRFYATGQTSTGGFGFISPVSGVNGYGLDIGGTLTPVPEPTTVAAGALAACALGWHQRRRFASLLRSGRSTQARI